VNQLTLKRICAVVAIVAAVFVLIIGIGSHPNGHDFTVAVFVGLIALGIGELL
jgi:preprotein translocase subunit SecF